MNFRGRALFLTEGGLRQAANYARVDLPEFLAVLEVETSAVGYLKDGRPKILFERHIFSRRTGGKFDSVNPLISWSTMGGYGRGGENQYNRLAQAQALDPSAAIYSASWGIGQVMGFNYARVGYGSVDEMVTSFCDSEDNQVMAVAAYIIKTSLDDELRRHDWSSFAYGYNGVAYQRNNYDVRLRDAFNKWRSVKGMDCQLRTHQAMMSFAGQYRGVVDGIDGPATRLAMAKRASVCSTPPLYYAGVDTPCVDVA